MSPDKKVITHFFLLICSGAGSLPPGSAEKIKTFLKMSDHQQSEALDTKESADELLRLFFNIVSNAKGDPDLVTLALMLIDGTLEQKRSRVNFLIQIQQTHKKDKRIDLIDMLISFLYQNKAQGNKI